MMQTEKEHVFVAIDMKSFYASVECVDRGLDPLTTNLVVADKSRTEKTICLAVSPSLKALGIGGRPRLFEVVQHVRNVNYDRKWKCKSSLKGKSYDAIKLREHPDWEVDYIVAPPRMAHYIKVSANVYKTYLKYVSSEDIHVYSIDEVFIDVTDYLRLYKMSAHELTMRMIRDVLQTTGITATAGIGTNMYLAKVAMDIVAKHKEPDSDGVRIAELDEMGYRRQLWHHKPLTDFWRIGRGTSNRLARYGIDTMGKIARMSLTNENFLYKLFGVNAELLIDHAWGWEPCTMKIVKSYKPETNSFSSGQVLSRPYSCKEAKVVVMEMADLMALDLVAKRMVTNQLTLTIGYDAKSLEGEKQYDVTIRINRYGKAVPKYAHGTVNLKGHSSSSSVIMKAIAGLYDRIVNPDFFIRRINITSNRVVSEKLITSSKEPQQLDLFVDYQTFKEQKIKEQIMLKKERELQETRLVIQQRFGKNAILKGLNYAEGATAKDRNKQIGGHKA